MFVREVLWNEEESFELRSCYTLESSTCLSPGRDGDFMQLSPPTPHKHERPVREQNSKLIMPYLAKCSVPTWNSDPHILLKGLYLKANYFGPLLASPWENFQDNFEDRGRIKMKQFCLAISFLPAQIPSFLRCVLWCKPLFAEEASFPMSSSCF